MLQIGLDRVSLTLQGQRKWQMERAKYEQWKERAREQEGKDEYDLAVDGITEQQ